MSNGVKQALAELADELPDECIWDDVMHHIYVRQKLEAGLHDVRHGRLTPHDRFFEELYAAEK